MEPVILMVCRGNEPEIYDLEVMPDVAMGDLADAIAIALQWQGTYDVEVGNTGRRLALQQSLADAEVWDGARLRLVLSNRPSRIQVGTAANTAEKDEAALGQGQDADSPVKTWRPVQVPDTNQAVPVQAPNPPPSSPLVGWRQPSPSEEKKP